MFIAEANSYSSPFVPPACVCTLSTCRRGLLKQLQHLSLFGRLSHARHVGAFTERERETLMLSLCRRGLLKRQLRCWRGAAHERARGRRAELLRALWCVHYPPT